MSDQQIIAANRVVELHKVNGLRLKEIQFVIERDYGVKWSTSRISDIRIGHTNADKITLTDDRIEELNESLDGVDAYKPKELTRLDKLGMVDQLESHTPQEVITHFNDTIDANINEQSLEAILIEVNELLEGDTLRTENELWFKELILSKRKLG